MALAEDDPYVEQLIEDASARKTAPLSRRELRTDAGLGALLLVAVVALAVLAPSARTLSPLGAIALIAAYALTQRVQFDVGAGYTVPSQLVFMPMLLLAPPALVPLLVAASFLVGRLPSYLRGARPPDAPGLRPRRRRLRRRARGRVACSAPARSASTTGPCSPWPSPPRRSATPASTVLRGWLAHGVPPSVTAAPVRVGLRRRRRARARRRPGRRRRRAPAVAVALRPAAHGPARPLRPRAPHAHRATRSRSRTPTAAPRC